MLSAIAAASLAAPMAQASANTQTRSDLSDAPTGAVGKADLRAIEWDVTGSSATLKISLDASTYTDCSSGPCVGSRAPFRVHVLLDTGGDDIADAELVANRSADGVKADVALRNLDGALSTTDCQALDGSGSTASASVTTTLAAGIEAFTFTFDPALLAGHLATFRWAAFAQAPPDPAAAGPWDVLPNAADPDPAAENPGDRRCDSAKSGLRVRLQAGVAFPDQAPPPQTDGDGDGIPDASDACPTESDVAAPRNPRSGCPASPTVADADADGVPNSSDACPLNSDLFAQRTPRNGCPSNIATSGNDTLNGTASADTLCGLPGNDILNGLAGNDTLFGDACGAKAKLVTAAAAGGSDTLNGGAGNDALYGAGGNDRLNGGKGNDKLYGGSGNDKLKGGPGTNSYSGGSGKDTINARNGKKETVNCGSGKKDVATIDKKDKVKSCEKVKRAKK